LNDNRPELNKDYAMHTFARITTNLVFICLLAVSANAAELVMFDRKGCQWSAKWYAEIGADAYNFTKEGRTAPLRMVDISAVRPSDLKFIGGIVDTPTFVLVENGKEIDRFVGYPSRDVFFGKVILMLDRLSGADRQYKTIIVQ